MKRFYLLQLKSEKLCSTFRIYIWNFRFFLFIWLTLSQAVGISSKQLEINGRFPSVLLQKIPVAFQKHSGLSALLPSSFLNGKNFQVEAASTKNITTQVGQTTYLHCIVDKQEDLTVSWIRLRDFHLLTVGEYTYTSDTRFLVTPNVYSNDWTLQIKYPQPGDEGEYECQISTDPPTSHFVNLKVLVPKAKILGGPNFYVSVGSGLNLTCVISDCPEAPAFVFWYHDGRMINFDRSKEDIILQKADDDKAISRLHISNAQTQDSGNYSCCPSNTDSTSIFVHVLKGEKHAAVQNDATSTSRSTRFTCSFHITSIVEALLCLLLYHYTQTVTTTR